ncbi:hypothetical protein WN51_04283 [Melipona quadrifasciata]|uniref:Uncharacterized protein n=1 Tax=Melipona quadrifasciata TaxID=166423 RepID=A0A0M8ZR49_9HYME|nr:hypothetical protein WN51_04283 [Melipona quadrifasciata]
MKKEENKIAENIIANSVVKNQSKSRSFLLQCEYYAAKLLRLSTEVCLVLGWIKEIEIEERTSFGGIFPWKKGEDGKCEWREMEKWRKRKTAVKGREATRVIRILRNRFSFESKMGRDLPIACETPFVAKRAGNEAIKKFQASQVWRQQCRASHIYQGPGRPAFRFSMSRVEGTPVDSTNYSHVQLRHVKISLVNQGMFNRKSENQRDAAEIFADLFVTSLQYKHSRDVDPDDSIGRAMRCIYQSNITSLIGKLRDALAISMHMQG